MNHATISMGVARLIGVLTVLGWFCGDTAHAVDPLTTNTWTGGAGATWNTTDTNWGGSGLATLWDVSTGPTNVARFNSSAATPNVSGTVYCNGMIFGQSATISNGTINLAGSAPAVTLTGSVSSVINSVIAGGSGLKFVATGVPYQGTVTLALGGTNTYTGPTSISGVANQSWTLLKAGSSEAFGPGGSADLEFGPVYGQQRCWALLNGHDMTVAGLNAPSGNDGGPPSFGNFVGNGGTNNVTLTVNTAAADSSFLGAVRDYGSGKLALTKDGPYKLTLYPWNTFSSYSGRLTVRNGTLDAGYLNNINSDGSLGNSSLSVILGGTGTTGTVVTGSGYTSDKPFTMAVGGAGAFQVDSGTVTLSGMLGGGGDLVKTGAGTLTVSNTGNGWGGGTTVSNGTLSIAGAYLADFSVVSVAGAATLNLNYTGTDTIGGLFLGGVDQGAGTWGRVGSGAEHESARLTGTGLLRVPVTRTWTGATDFTWDLAGNWSPAAVPTNGALVIFPESGNYYGGTAVEWSGAKTVWMIRFDSIGNSVTLGPDAGGESLTVDVIDVTSGSSANYEIKSDVALNTSLTVNNASSLSLLAISGAVSGSYGISKTGTGSVTLSGTNTYTGGTIVSGGTLTISGANSFTGATTIATGAKLVLGAAGSISNTRAIGIATNATFDISAQSYVMSGNQTYTIGVNSAGTGSVGTIIASDLNITNGVLVLDVTGTLDDAAYVLATYSVLTGTKFKSVTGVPAGYGIKYNYGGGTRIALVPLGTLTWAGPPGGTWNSTGTNWTPVTTDPWTILNGPVNIGMFNTAGATPIVSGDVYCNGMTFSQSATISNGTINLAGSAPAVTLTGSVSSVINSVIAGGSGLKFVATGVPYQGTVTLTLGGTNTYTGPTSISGVANQSWTLLKAGSSEAFGPGNSADLEFGPVYGQQRCWALLNGHDMTVAGLNAPSGNDGGPPSFGNFVGNGGTNNVTLTVNTATADSSFLGALRDYGSGKLALTKDGPYKLTLYPWNTFSSYSGRLTVRNGTLDAGYLNNMNSDGSLGNSSLSVILGGTGTTGTVVTGSGYTSDKPFTMASGGAGVFQVDSGTVGIGGLIDGSGGLTKSGSGVLTLSGTNTFVGPVSVVNGTLRAGVAATASGCGAFGSNAAVTVANVPGVILDVAGFAVQIGSLDGGGAAGGNVTLGTGVISIGGNNSNSVYDGVISGLGGITKIGSGKLTLSRASTYAGATSVSNGVLELGGAGSISNSSSVVIWPGAVYSVTNKPIYTMLAAQTNVFCFNTSGTGSAGRIDAGGMVISNASVAFSGLELTDHNVYIIASYTSLFGEKFASITNLPNNFIIDYAYLTNRIAVVWRPGTVMCIK